MQSRSKRLCTLAAFMLATGIGLQAQISKTVSVNLENSDLKTLFQTLQKQTGCVFSYSDDILKQGGPVSIKMQAPASKILTTVLNSKNLSFKQVSDKSILIVTGKQKEKSSNAAKATAQNTNVSGVLVDDKGDAIIGGTVQVKGTSIATVTDIDGNWTLKNLPADSKIVFSFLGYSPKEIKASDSDALAKVMLSEDTKTLGEVVVVGYGTQKRANLTGAVATLSSDDINNRPVATAAGALQGADPSVNLTFNSGSMDAGYAIDIRGVASINGGSPLVMCDGMEVSLNQINPNDIESISILKDASASAIYGAKASSGVILITTKSGKNSDGKANVSYNGRYGWRQNTTSTDFINTGYDHVDIVNSFYAPFQGKLMWGYEDEDLAMLEARRNDKTENPDRPWTIEKNGKLYFYANHDWYDYFYNKTRPETEHNISVTGGNKTTNYFVSGRYLEQDGIFKIYNDKYKNYSFRSKLEAKLFPIVKYTGNFNFNATDYKYAGYYDEQMTIHSLQSNINSAVLPFAPTGEVIQYVNTMTGANSPLGAGHAGFLSANESRNSRGKKDVIISNQLDIDIFKDLVLTASYAYRYSNRGTKYRSMPFDYLDKTGVMKTFTSGSITDYYQEKHNNGDRHSVNMFATYNHTWNELHNFKAVGGFQFEDDRATNLSVKKSDLLSKDLSSMSVATGEAIITQDIASYRTLGYFGRVNYDFDGKYLFEASGRYDGSSRFSPNDRWGFFPSASAGWRISQENFWEPLANVWNNFKLRVSAGSLGNQQVSNYAYFDQIYTDKVMSYTFDKLAKGNYATVSAPITSHLTWEKVITYNTGIDFGFLNNRLTGSADFFIRDTKDMLTYSLTLPAVFGADTPKENCADLRTKGWEVALRWNDQVELAGRPLSYGVSASIGDYISKITKFNNPDKIIGNYYEGMTLGEIWGYKVDGLFATDEEAAAYQAQINDKAVNTRVYNCKQDNILKAGDVKFIDLDGNNIINEGSGTVNDPGDRRIIGNSLPRYNYSFRADLNYFGFDISAFFQGVGKRDWFPTTYAYDFWGPYSFPSLSFIQKDFRSNCWSETNPNAYFPRERGYQTYGGGSLSVPTDRYIQNASYLRLKNLTIGYTVPVKKNKFVQQVRVYATGENLFYWSPMKKYCLTVDPEMANASDSYNAGSGVGYSYSKSVSIGVDVKF